MDCFVWDRVCYTVGKSGGLVMFEPREALKVTQIRADTCFESKRHVMKNLFAYADALEGEITSADLVTLQLMASGVINQIRLLRAAYADLFIDFKHPQSLIDDGMKRHLAAAAKDDRNVLELKPAQLAGESK